MDYTKLICHRIPERSFFIGNHQFPVCARCTGFYIGFIFYFIYAYFFYVNYNLELISFALILLMPAAIDGTTQLFEMRISNNKLRFITGLFGGLGLEIKFKAIKFFMLLNYFSL